MEIKVKKKYSKSGKADIKIQYPIPGPNKVFKDNSKYTRKSKHKENVAYERI
jgi:hypothetical protein